MPDVGLAPVADGAASRSDRRTLLVGTAGALAAVGLSGPARAAGSAASVSVRRRAHFDPAFARQLQQALHDALSDPGTHSPGAILHVHSPKLGAWCGAAGLGRLAPAEPMRPDDRFRAGSIVKPFVSVTVLLLAERGRLSLDARLPEVPPASVTGRFANAGEITVRMLLGHRAGSRNGTTRRSTIRSHGIPRRCGRSPSSRPRGRASPRCSRPGRASSTPTPTTPCSA